MQVIRNLYDWMGTQVHAKYALSTLAFLFFLDAIFFFPAEPVLALYCLERKEHALRYASVATIAAVFGGLISYGIGYFIWFYMGHELLNNHLLTYVVKPEVFTYLCTQFKNHDWLTMLLLGCTPLPFKAVTLTAGFCQLSLVPYLICSCIVRGARFFALAWVLVLCGPHMKKYIDRYFTLFVLCSVLIATVLFYMLKR